MRLYPESGIEVLSVGVASLGGVMEGGPSSGYE